MKIFTLCTIVFNAVAFLSLSDGQLTDPFSVTVGEEVCFEGFVMDNFCIERGTLLDNPDVITLEGPDKHSVHCLCDIPSCYMSNYEILMEPIEGGNEYIRAFQFDDEHGKQDLIAAARNVGECSTCEDGGSLDKGFRAEIRGTVVTARNGDVPAMVHLEMVQHSNDLTTVCSVPKKQYSGNPQDNSSEGSGVDTVTVLSALSVIAMGILLAFSILKPVAIPSTLPEEQKFTYSEPSSRMSK